MTCSLETIEKVCTAPGGLKSIQIFLPEEVLSMPTAFCDPLLDGNIQVAADGLPITIPFTKNTAQLTERPIQNEDAGDYFEQTLTFDLAKDRIEVLRLIARLQNRRVHCITVDRSDQKRLLLNLRVAPAFTTGQRWGDLNTYSFTLSGQTTAPAPLFTGIVSATDGLNGWVDPQGNFWIAPDGQIWETN
jgi:hypothetical protein